MLPAKVLATKFDDPSSVTGVHVTPEIWNPNHHHKTNFDAKTVFIAC